MKDASLQIILKTIARGRYGIDLVFTRLVKKMHGEPRYVLKGACKQCGMCCQTPMIPVYSAIIWFKSLRFIFLSWHRFVNGLEYLFEDRKSQVFVFSCTHYDPVSQRCDSYKYRPGFCRDYPTNLLYSANPEFLSKCGHYAALKNAEGFRTSLEKINLSSEKRDELYKKLYLKE